MKIFGAKPLCCISKCLKVMPALPLALGVYWHVRNSSSSGQKRRLFSHSAKEAGTSNVLGFWTHTSLLPNQISALAALEIFCRPFQKFQWGNMAWHRDRVSCSKALPALCDLKEELHRTKKGWMCKPTPRVHSCSNWQAGDAYWPNSIYIFVCPQRTA